MKKLSFSAWAMILFLAALLILFFVLPRSDYSSTEKRFLAGPPEVTWDSLYTGDFSEALEDYLADHFPGRNLFVGVNAYWNLLTGRGNAGDIYHAKDGYLIQAPATADTTQLTATLGKFETFAAANGLPATLIPVPSTGYLLSDKLPAGSLPYPDDEAFRVMQETCQSVQLLDLRETLRAADGQMYYKTDHHLTSRGCFTVYNAFREARGLAAKPETDYNVSAYPGFHGTTWSSSGYWLNPADTVEVWDAGDELTVTITEAGSEDVVTGSPFFLENLEEDDMYTTFLDGNHTIVDVVNPNADGGKLLVIRDSFAHCLAPFLASDYSEILLIDLRYYRGSLSQLAQEHGITEILFVYGVSNLLTDTNSAWLF